MRFLDHLRALKSKVIRPSEIHDELEEELRSHIALRADDLERSGLPRAEAERRARIEFGARERYQEECHETLAGNRLANLLQDLRYSLRVLRKSPGFTIAAVITLSLSIGANALVFSVMNTFLLRPLNVPEPHSLWNIERGRYNDGTQSYLDYLDLRDRNRSFEDLMGFSIATVGIDSGKDPARAWAIEATGNYFDVLKLRPYLGEFFHASDEHGPNSAPYVVLGYAYWHTHFHDDASVVGRIITLNKHPFTVLGVAPPGFRGTVLFFNPDMYVPLVNQEQMEGTLALNDRGNHTMFEVLGHLKPGITTEQAIADLNSIGAALEKSYPKEDSDMIFRLARPGLHGNYLRGPMQAFFAGLMLLAGLILLAACANLGSLFAARSADRSREVALRLALGSSRRRIVRQLFLEAIMVAIVGGVGGVWGTALLLRALSTWQPIPRYPLSVTVHPDATVYAVALLLTLASGLLFGAVPVRQVIRTDPHEVVKSGSTGKPGRRTTVRDVLLVVQIAICAVLVTSSFVAVRGLTRSLHSRFGFDPQNTTLLDTNLSMSGYSGEKVPVIQKKIVDALAGVPGVDAVGLCDSLPLGDGWASLNVFSEQVTDLRPANALSDAFVYSVSPEFFRASGTTLLSGRNFTWHDDANAPRVAIVNEDFARTVFGSVANAIGRFFKLPDGTLRQVVGVVEGGKYWSLTERRSTAMFFPIAQVPSSSTWLVVRSGLDPQQLGGLLRSSVASVDPSLPVYIQSRDKELEGKMFAPRIATISLGVLGMMGAMLAITGVFGMAAYSVSRRLRELGIRIALGAKRRELLNAALGHAVKLLVFGSVAGLLLGVLASRVLASLVYEATPRDPLVLTGVVLSMGLLGLLATWIPAQRALSIDPVRLLRDE